MEQTPEQVDALLPYLLKRDVIGQYKEGKVIIGDRRNYPFEKSFVTCDDVESVALAIKGMVTQGGGPWVAAAYALAMEARRLEGKPQEDMREGLRQAAALLKETRPTSIHLHIGVERALKAGEAVIDRGENVEQGIIAWIKNKRDELLLRSAKMGRFGADMIADGDGILTMCFAETAFLLGLAFAKEDGKDIYAYVPETRPYLQGARLTAPSIHEMGIPVKLITDNMPGYIVSQGKVQKYMTAADLVTLDGHVVNKIGTFQNALAAHFYGVPYFAYNWEPDHHHPDRDSIKIEERAPQEIRRARGVPTTIDELDSYYPAFDITPPHLVAGVITKYGILSPYDLARYFSADKVEA